MKTVRRRISYLEDKLQGKRPGNLRPLLLVNHYLKDGQYEVEIGNVFGLERGRILTPEELDGLKSGYPQVFIVIAEIPEVTLEESAPQVVEVVLPSHNDQLKARESKG
jgi:hypothetical protein